MERHGEGIAEADRPDGLVLAARHRVERIVGRDGPVGVDAQDFSQEGVKRLRLRGIHVFSHGGVQRAVGAERERATVVIRFFAEVVELENDHLAVGHRDVAARGEAADAIVDGRGRRRVIHVYILIALKRGIERHAKEASLTHVVDRQRHERRGQQRASLDHAEVAALFGDEQPPVRGELHGRRTREPGRDQHLAEPGRQRRRMRGSALERKNE